MTSKFIYAKNIGVGAPKLFCGVHKKFLKESKATQYVASLKDRFEGEIQFLLKNTELYKKLWTRKVNHMKSIDIPSKKIVKNLLEFARGNSVEERVKDGMYIPREDSQYIPYIPKNVDRSMLVSIMAKALSILIYDEKFWIGENRNVSYWLEFMVQWFEHDFLESSRFERLVYDEDMNMFQTEVREELFTLI